MKIKFDSNQQYQLDAVNAVVDVFDGQPRARGRFEVSLIGGAAGLFEELGVGNALAIGEDALLENARTVQERNEITLSEKLHGLNFAVAMETGTGKTYIYLRTAYELHARYGFTKFVVVVPSVAIREGVLKNLQLTEEHFRALYANTPCDYWGYDAARVSSVRQFANSNQLQIMIMNIDAFNKPASNVIHQDNDRLSGRKPVEFVQAARPIVIVDEPQNMESEGSKTAIESLNPLCTLRYSATHKNAYTMLYKLDPVRAYDLKLVKRIEVDSIVERADFNRPYIRVDAITPAKDRISAKLTIDVQAASGPVRKAVTVSKRKASDVVDLYEKSGKRELYQGYVIDDINANSNVVSFKNGHSVHLHEAVGARTDDVMRAQVFETVQEHLEKERRFFRALPEGGRLKVLSLFFIDRVANYTGEDAKIRRWFEEAYVELAARERYTALNLPPVASVHNGYFAESSGVAKDTTGRTKADEDAYALIMKDKERLLSRDEPLRFIFSHSALREGWDNPNVFQICTLNETRSEMRKRQEIGRGLRLPVDESGNRVFDDAINRLTLVANESYADFAKALQNQIEDERGVRFKERIENKRLRRAANLKEGWQFNADFMELWGRIKHKTRYSVEYDSENLIQSASLALRAMPAIEPPKIVRRVDEILIGARGVATQMRSAERDLELPDAVTNVPDILGQLQRETELTRRTLAEILKRSGRLQDLLINPQQFTDMALRAVRRTLDEVMADGIRYETIEGTEYEMTIFETKAINGYENRMVEVSKSLYDAIEADSDVEAKFAQGLDGREDIKLFLKLPDWFKIDTPVGTYNPDWAIVKQVHADETKLYLIKESKSTHDPAKRRPEENVKIHCGHAHFDALDGVEYAVATSVDEV